LLFAYWSYFPNLSWTDWIIGHSLPGRDAAGFATAFFAAFMGLQFAIVILLTPAWATTALAEERSKTTLTFLLTSRLTSREIIFGMMFTRLMQLGLLIATGLPVLGLLQFLGGVDPMMPITAFAALALTGLSLGGISMLCALYAKKPE